MLKITPQNAFCNLFLTNNFKTTKGGRAKYYRVQGVVYEHKKIEGGENVNNA